MNNIEQFILANQIAATAALLDSDKNEFPKEAKEIAVICVNNLHSLAKKLAGNQVGKIYT